jgi:hypothetical protein
VEAIDEQWASDAGTILLRFRRGKVVLRAFFGRNGEQLGDPERPWEFEP